MIRDRIKGTNAFVIFDNHEDLLKRKDLLDEMYKKLDSVFNIIRNRLKSGDLNKNSFDAYRIIRSKFMITVVITKNKHNPYIFVQNRIGDKSISKYFTYEDIINLTEDESLQEMKDKFQKLGKTSSDLFLMNDSEKNILLAEIKDIEQDWDDSKTLDETKQMTIFDENDNTGDFDSKEADSDDFDKDDI